MYSWFGRKRPWWGSSSNFCHGFGTIYEFTHPKSASWLYRQFKHTVDRDGMLQKVGGFLCTMLVAGSDRKTRFKAL